MTLSLLIPPYPNLPKIEQIPIDAMLYPGFMYKLYAESLITAAGTSNASLAWDQTSLASPPTPSLAPVPRVICLHFPFFPQKPRTRLPASTAARTQGSRCHTSPSETALAQPSLPRGPRLRTTMFAPRNRHSLTFFFSPPAAKKRQRPR